jgi:hypothetical protein
MNTCQMVVECSMVCRVACHYHKDVEFHRSKNLLKHELKLVLGSVQHNHESTLLQDKVVNLHGHLKGLEERKIKGM